MSKPQVNLNIDGLMLIGLGIGVPLLGFIGYKLYGARDAIAGAVDKVNPASQNNIVNQAVESVGQSITGDPNWTLGGWAFDWTHHTDGTFNYVDPAYDITGFLPATRAASQIVSLAEKVVPYVNPVNPGNVVNTAVTKAVGEQSMATAADKVFGAIDLLNPFNSDDTYAKIIWGVE